MLFNPLRPHIIEVTNTKYAVRKLTFVGWQYYDNQKLGFEDFWWYQNKSHIYVDSLDQARKNLQQALGPKVYTL